MKSENGKGKLPTKSGMWILIVAAAVLEAISCTMYFTSRAAIRRAAEERAKTELKKAEQEIEMHTIEMETAAKGLALLAQKHLNHPDMLFEDTRLAVSTIRQNTSLAIAFVPDYFPRKGRYFEVCSSRISEDSIFTRQIGSAAHDYTQMEWYRNGFEHDSCWWCEPYMDDSGSKAMVVSCSCPVYDGKGKVVAVVCVDLALSYLQEKLPEYLQVYENSYFSIRSGTGKDIVKVLDTIPGRKYNFFNEEIDATGWHIEIIIPEEELFKDLNRVGRIVSLLMLIGLILLGLIVWHTTRTVRQLVKAREQNQRMESELEIAQTIQMSMLPKNEEDSEQSTNIHGFLRPAREVGGDLYDFFERDGKRFFCIGDVSGKGVPAALVMATTRSLFRSVSEHEQDPASIMAQINSTVTETNEQDMFVTLFVGILDLHSGELRYCNAGHNAPVMVENRTTGSIKADNLPVLPNLPIGVMGDFVYQSQSATLMHGDTLFLYTDGLTEAENSRHEQYGEQRMTEVLKAKGENEESDARAVVNAMYDSVTAFVDGAEQSDDLTMLAIRWLKYSLVMRNDIQQIPTLAEWMDTLGIPPALNMPLNLALEEAVANVMLYAYPGKHGKVLIEADINNKQITFVISDSGVPFDPTQKPEADISLPAEERAIGGLGIHLVRQIMDKIRYERKNNKNILTLVKKL